MQKDLNETDIVEVFSAIFNLVTWSASLVPFETRLLNHTGIMKLVAFDRALVEQQKEMQ